MSAPKQFDGILSLPQRCDVDNYSLAKYAAPRRIAHCQRRGVAVGRDRCGVGSKRGLRAREGEENE